MRKNHATVFYALGMFLAGLSLERVSRTVGMA